MSESGESSSVIAPTTPLTALPETARPYRFTWDPAAARRPGPESVSGTTTDGRGEYFATKLGDFQFNASSASLALGALPNEWSSAKHGFHAISTVLNNPHKRQAPPKAHSALPAVPPAELPRVKRKDFDPYLRAIAPEWERFETHVNQPEAGPSTPRASVGSISSLAPQSQSIPPLDTVPSVFFEQDFDLGDPRTFATVTEQDQGSDPTSVSDSLPLVERLSHYADTIEMHLSHEISLRSSSFFAALSNLHMLQSESESCLSQISRLRKLLDEVDEDVAKRGLQIVQADRKMKNVGKVQEGIAGIKEMVDMTGMARNLATAGQWSEALQLVEEIERCWEAPDKTPQPTPVKPNGRLSPTPEESESSPTHRHSLSVPLSSLRAFSALPNHLKNMTMEIASSLSSELVIVLREDLLSRIEGRTSKGVGDRLNPLLQGLVRTRGLKEATLSWREVVLTEMRGLVGKHFPDYDMNADSPEPSGSTAHTGSSKPRPGLANHLRTIAQSDFMTVMRQIYASLLNAVEGLHAQGVLIGELLIAIEKLSATEQTLSSIQSELTDILSSATELSHTQAAKVVSARSEQHAALPLPEFVEVFNESWNFVVKCEVICRRMIVGLRGAIVGQAKTFLQTFHQSRLTQSAKLVEDEQWSPQDVSQALQRTVNLIVDSAMKDPAELIVNTTSIISPTTPGSGRNGILGPPSPLPVVNSPSAPLVPNAVTPGPSKHLRIEDRTYFIVPATAEALMLLLDYLRVIINLGTLTTDAMSRVIEFLKAFNSRTCQVVLGAGAMRSAGLKNITAKHLALASQSLSIMISLIPYVRETFRRHLNPKQAVILVEFDKLKRDYQEHQNEIHAKLIAIMGDRLTAHIRSLQAVDWSVPKAGGGVNDYMELLVKETVTLHKVLSRYLSATVVEDVMAQVFAAINHRLSEEYTKIELPHAEAKSRLLADAKFLHRKLSALKNVGTPSAMLETVVSEKSIPRPGGTAPMTPAPPPSTPGSATSQRLKNLLSAKSAVSAFEKALPSPVSASLQPQTAPPNNGVNGSNTPRASKESVPLPAPPTLEKTPSSRVSTPVASGFKQVEMSEEALEEAQEPTVQQEKLENSTVPSRPPTEVEPRKDGTSTPPQNDGPASIQPEGIKKGTVVPPVESRPEEPPADGTAAEDVEKLVSGDNLPRTPSPMHDPTSSAPDAASSAGKKDTPLTDASPNP